MPELLRMPEVVTGATTATLSEWVVKEAQRYEANDVLATIETDKAVVDFSAEVAGVLLKILLEPGTEAPVGHPSRSSLMANETVNDIEAALALLNGATEDRSSSNGHAIRRASQPLACRRCLARAGDCCRGTEFSDLYQPSGGRLGLAAGLDPESIVGTGPGGRIIRRDVEFAIAQIAAAESPTKSPAIGLKTSEPAVKAPLRDQAVPVCDSASIDIENTRARRALAQQVTRSKQSIPHFYLRGSALVDDLLELRAGVNAATPAKRLRYRPRCQSRFLCPRLGSVDERCLDRGLREARGRAWTSVWLWRRRAAWSVPFYAASRRPRWRCSLKGNSRPR